MYPGIPQECRANGGQAERRVKKQPRKRKTDVGDDRLDANSRKITFRRLHSVRRKYEKVELKSLSRVHARPQQHVREHSQTFANVRDLGAIR